MQWNVSRDHERKTQESDGRSSGGRRREALNRDTAWPRASGRIRRGSGCVSGHAGRFPPSGCWPDEDEKRWGCRFIPQSLPVLTIISIIISAHSPYSCPAAPLPLTFPKVFGESEAHPQRLSSTRRVAPGGAVALRRSIRCRPAAQSKATRKFPDCGCGRR